MNRPIKSFSSYGPLHQVGRNRILLFSSLLFLLTPAITAASDIGHSRASSAQQSADARGAIAQKEDAPRVLEPGKPVVRELAGDEIHSYQITLAAGQFLKAEVDQRGINVLLVLHDPNDKTIAEVNGLFGSQGLEQVSLIADLAGSYRLEVRPMQKTAPKGRYEARIEELRAATPQDKVRVTAERTFAEATLMAGQGTGESWRKAIEKYLETLPVWQSLADPKQEAYALTAIGYSYLNLSEHRQALDFYHKALALMKTATEPRGEAIVLYQMGMTYNILGERPKALELYGEALKIQRAVGDRSMEASTLGNTGSVHAGLGEYRKALEFYNQSRAIKREIGDPPGEATLLTNIGLVHSRLGEQQKALEYYNQALPILRALNDRSGEGTTLNNIGAVYEDLGDYRKALDLYSEVVQIKRAAGNPQEEAIGLGNLGGVYAKLGEHRKAMDFYNQALSLSKTAGARSMEAISLSNIGRAYGDLGEHRKALDYYYQALSLHVAIGDRRAQGTTLTNIGRAYQDLGEPQKALGFYNQALAIRRAIGDRSGEALTLYNFARARRDLNNLVEARTAIEEALAAVESLRINVRSPQLRSSFLASVRRYYEFHVDVLMRLHKQQPSEGFAAAALHASERGRARSLLEMLKEARAEIRHGVNANLIERERRLRQTIGDKAERHTRLLSGKHSADDAAAMEKEIEALATEYEQVQGEIRQASPRYAALTQPEPLTLKEIQTQIQDPDTLLLEYALGDEKSYLWAVTPTSISSFELPKRQYIEAAARELHETLTARNKSISNEPPEQRRQRLVRAEAEYVKKAAALSEMILGPVAAELKSKRLLIVSEGALQYVPFAALPEPLTNLLVESGRLSVAQTTPTKEQLADRKDQRARNNGERPAATFKPLVLDHEIVSLPSASVLAVLRQETIDRKPPSMTLAVLADPVFSGDDPRLVSVHQKASATIDESSSSEDLKRSATESGLPDLVRLRFSRLEAEEISKLAPDKMKLKALDFDASRTVAINEDLGQYRIVHFATHGLINNQNPELSGVVLSLVDARGLPQNGFLRLYDIYNLKLSADLVVLSACQTALGKDIKGEGIVGLTRGFMYAGAPRVVASLWQVDDRATAQLMRRFYAGMLGKGLHPAAALRAAQVSMLRENRWQAPYYWAAFTLQGDWK